jgi:hypothetical protein
MHLFWLVVLESIKGREDVCNMFNVNEWFVFIVYELSCRLGSLLRFVMCRGKVA